LATSSAADREAVIVDREAQFSRLRETIVAKVLNAT